MGRRLELSVKAAVEPPKRRRGDRAAGNLDRVWQYPQRITKSDAPRAGPRCAGQPLDRKSFSDTQKVEIDQCPKCNGIWLDDGEFTEIFAVIKHAKSELSPWSAAIAEAVEFLQSSEGQSGAAPERRPG